MRYTPLNGISFSGASSNFLKPYGGSVKNNTPLFILATSLGLENFLPSNSRGHRRLLSCVARSRLLDGAIAGVGEQDAVLVEDGEAVGAGFAPDVRVRARGAGGIEEFLEAALLRPLPHLVAGHVGEQQIAAGLHPDRDLRPSRSRRRVFRSSSPSGTMASIAGSQRSMRRVFDLRRSPGGARGAAQARRAAGRSGSEQANKRQQR